MSQSQRILIVSEALDDSFRQVLEKNRFEVSWEGDPERAGSQLSNQECALLIIDLADPDVAVALLRRVRALPNARELLVLILAQWGTGQPTLALSQGADAFEPKPVAASGLLVAVEKLLRPRLAKTARASTANSDREDE